MAKDQGEQDRLVLSRNDEVTLKIVDAYSNALVLVQGVDIREIRDSGPQGAANGSEVFITDFSGSPTSGLEGMTVQFTGSSSSSPTAWAWDFGDGSSSTEQNPSHTYPNAGQYTVSLAVTRAGGTETETKVNYISVGAVVWQETVKPVLENGGTFDNGDGTRTAEFGYYNGNDFPVVIPAGADNKFTPNSLDRGQPTVLLPGRHYAVFSVTLPEGSGNLVWTLKSPEGVTRTSTANF